MKYSTGYDKREKWILGGIIAVGIILRVGAALYLGNQVVELPGTADQVSYHTLAQRVLGGYGLTFAESWWPVTPAGAPTAHWSYPYTAYLVLVYAIFGNHALAARIIQAVIVGALQPYLVFLIGRRLFNSPIGLLSAAITAVYTYFVYYAATLMTESFYITAILGNLYAAIRLTDQLSLPTKPGLNSKTLQLSFGLGIWMGAAVLLRQVYLLFIPFLILWVWWASREKDLKTVNLALILSGTILALMILPFTVFNYIRFDRFVLLNTNAGYAFYLANHPIYGSHFEPILPPEMGTYLDLIPVEVRRLRDEALVEQELMRRGIQFVLDDPGRYIWLSISRIPPYFMFWPSAESGAISNLSRVFGFGLLLPFMIYGLVRSFIAKPPSPGVQLKSPVFLLILFMLIYSSIHILTWTLIRYRLPVDAVLIIFSALAFFDIYERLRRFAEERRVTSAAL